jgi:hypothetical protein
MDTLGLADKNYGEVFKEKIERLFGDALPRVRGRFFNCTINLAGG